MTYLIDTNVISEIARRRRNTGVLDWLAATSTSDHHISVLTIGELSRGIQRVRARGDHHQVRSLEQALSTVREDFSERIVPVTLDVAEEWARQPLDRPAPIIDALIGATARARGWTLVTRNVRDFQHIGVPLINPFTDEEAP